MSWFQNNSLLKVLMLSFIIIVGYLIITDREDVTYGKVEVKYGDTLWTLAEKYKGSMSTDEWISFVKKENNLSDDMIVAGKHLTIPISTDVLYVAENDEDNERIYVKAASNE